MKKKKNEKIEEGVIPETPNWILELGTEKTENNIEQNLTDEQYNSIIENYEFNKNYQLSHTLRWLEKYIEKNTQKK